MSDQVVPKAPEQKDVDIRAELKNIISEQLKEILKSELIDAKTIRDEVSTQLKEADSIDNISSKNIDPEYTAEQFIEDVLTEHETNKRLHGANNTCLRENGVDIPYEWDWKKYKIVMMHLEGCPKEDIISTVKRWWPNN